MLLWAIVYFVFGSVLMIHWGLAMFTDTGPGEFAREISAEMGVKNNLALTMPSGALMFLLVRYLASGIPTPFSRSSAAPYRRFSCWSCW